MPAPTALLKQVDDDLPSQDLSLEETNQDEDFELGNIDSLPEDANAVLQPVKRTEESDMEIDEEDKPQFAPAQNTVCPLPKAVDAPPYPERGEKSNRWVSCRIPQCTSNRAK